MDSITQIVLGAAVGELILGKKIGNKAALWGAIGGTIPDLDVIGQFFMSDIDGLLFHRGFMHSIFFVFLIGPLISYIPYKIYLHKYIKITYFDWWLLIFSALITHPLLDGFTTWGTQLFWPFNYRVAIKSIFVVDPLYTIPFAFFLLFSLCLPKYSIKRRVLNSTGLMISTLFLLYTPIRQMNVKQIIISDLISKKIEFEQVSIRALPLNIIWNVSVKTKEGFYNTVYSKNTKNNLSYVYTPSNKELLPNDILISENYKKLTKMVGEMYIVDKISDKEFIVNDLRFGKTTLDFNNEGSFMFQYKIIQLSNGAYDIQFIQNKPDANKIMKEFSNYL